MNTELLKTITDDRVAGILASRFKSLAELSSASFEELRGLRVGPATARRLMAAFDLGREVSRERHVEGATIDNPSAAVDLLREDYAGCALETMKLICLNTRRKLIRIVTISNGTLDSLHISPRDLFREAIVCRASAVILAHNHPSGDPSPSTADIQVTRDLIRAGQLLKIEVQDHVILGKLSEHRDRDFVSLREMGFFHS